MQVTPSISDLLAAQKAAQSRDGLLGANPQQRSEQPGRPAVNFGEAQSQKAEVQAPNAVDPSAISAALPRSEIGKLLDITI